MRNFSMKKFGTPIGAGPGVAEEKLGFCGVGVPSGLVSAFGDDDLLLRGPVRPPSPPPAGREAVCSDPRTGAPFEEPVWVPCCAGCEDGAGEDEPEGDDGDWEPPDDGGEEEVGGGVS